MSLDKKIWWRKFTKTNKIDRKKFLKNHYKTLGYSKVPKISEFKNDFNPKNNKTATTVPCNKAKEKEELDKLNEQRIWDYFQYFRPNIPLFDNEGNLSKESLKIIEDDFKDVKKSNKVKIRNIYALDVSSSMTYLLNGCKSSIIEEVENLKNEAIKNNITIEFGLVCFGSYVSDILEPIDVLKVDIRNVLKNIHSNGMTALTDAILRCYTYVDKDYSNLIKVFTDGGENASNSNYKDAENIIKNTENTTFTFSGIDRDVKIACEKYGIDVSNVITHDNTIKSILDNSKVTLQATSNYIKRTIKGEKVNKGFYKQIK